MKTRLQETLQTGQFKERASCVRDSCIMYRSQMYLPLNAAVVCYECNIPLLQIIFFIFEDFIRIHLLNICRSVCDVQSNSLIVGFQTKTLYTIYS